MDIHILRLLPAQNIVQIGIVGAQRPRGLEPRVMRTPRVGRVEFIIIGDLVGTLRERVVSVARRRGPVVGRVFLPYRVEVQVVIVDVVGPARVRRDDADPFGCLRA